MSDKLSQSDARELIRIMHEDQGSRTPAFSSEFALRVINRVNDWFQPNNYYGTLWLERWEDAPIEEQAPAVRLNPGRPSTGSLDDDCPF